RRLREEPAPLVKADGVRFHSRKLCQPPDQQRLVIHRVSNAACSRVIRPSNMIAPSTATVGIARTPYALPSSHICCGGQRRSITSQPHEATASFTSRHVSSQSEQPAVKTSIFLLSVI